MTSSAPVRTSHRRFSFSRTALALAVAATLAALSACGTSDDKAPLAFVPAQTPYVFASMEPLPDGVIESWGRLMAPIQTAYSEMLAQARAKLEKGGDDPEKTRRMLSIMELFEDKLSLEGWERIGFSREGRAAIYGVGVLPVMRIELGDPDALRAFVGELETRTGETLPVAEIDGQSYWRIVPEADKPFAVVAAIIDRHLVMTLDPGSDQAPLADLLGLNPPAESMLDSEGLNELNDEFGFGPHGTLLLDARRLMAELLGAEGEDTWFTQAMAAEGETLSPACRSEFSAMAEAMPRMVGGYTSLDASSMDSQTIIELRSDLAQGLMPIAAPVPGLGGRADGSVALDFGFGMKLDKLGEFIQARASAIRAAPYACEHLLSLNQGAEQVGQQMAGLYMAAGWFTGMRAVVTELTWGENNQPETVEGAMIIASPNPAGLVGMLQGFVPQLAELNLVANADPVPVALGEMAGMGSEVPPTFAAMSDTAIGLGFGPSAPTQLPGYLSAPATQPAPLLYIGYNGAFYARMMKQIQAMTAAQAGMAMADEGDAGEILDEEIASADGSDGLAGDDGVQIGGDETMPDPAVADTSAAEMQAFMAPMMESLNAMYEAIDYTTTDVTVTERGIEMRQVLRLK